MGHQLCQKQEVLGCNMNEAKILIIYGNDNVDGKNRNGEIECLGKINSDNLHISCFINFFQNNFLDNPIFKNITNSTIPNNVGYALAQKGHISFFNTTREGKPKSGFFMLPPNLDDITPEQKENISQIVKTLNGYNIKLLYDYFINDYGLLDSKFCSIDEFTSIDDFLTNYKFIKNFKLI